MTGGVQKLTRTFGSVLGIVSTCDASDCMDEISAAVEPGIKSNMDKPSTGAIYRHVRPLWRVLAPEIDSTMTGGGGT